HRAADPRRGGEGGGAAGGRTRRWDRGASGLTPSRDLRGAAAKPRLTPTRGKLGGCGQIRFASGRRDRCGGGAWVRPIGRAGSAATQVTVRAPAAGASRASPATARTAPTASPLRAS